MAATPAEVANDLAAQAVFLVKRDDDLASLCRDSARLIRAIIAGQAVCERTYARVLFRLRVRVRGCNSSMPSQIDKSLLRALETLQTLQAE